MELKFWNLNRFDSSSNRINTIRIKNSNLKKEMKKDAET